MSQSHYRTNKHDMTAVYTHSGAKRKNISLSGRYRPARDVASSPSPIMAFAEDVHHFHTKYLDRYTTSQREHTWRSQMLNKLEQIFCTKQHDLEQTFCLHVISEQTVSPPKGLDVKRLLKVSRTKKTLV